MSLLIVRDGAFVSQDPNDSLVYTMDWDTDNLLGSATISGHVFAITQLRGGATPALAKDSESILPAWTDSEGHTYAALRTTQLRLTGGPLGAVYRIDETITTNESPSQTKNRHFKLGIRQK